MKLLHTEASSGWGGQEIRIFREAIGMRERGYGVALAVSPGAELGKKARAAGFNVYEVPFSKSSWPSSFFQLKRILAEERVDLIHTHSSLDAWLGGIVGRCTGRKVVRTRHLSGTVRGGLNSRLLYGRLADFVTTTCRAIVPPLIASSKKPEELFLSIPTGIEPKEIPLDVEAAERFRHQIGAGSGDFLVGTACFMRSWKGIPDFLGAAKRGQKDPRKKWVIIGGGHEATYRKLAEEMGLQDTVRFTGHLANPFPALQALDAFALLSTANEGVSQAILQAAFLGKPLIATSTGGLPEVCLEGVTGLQVPLYAPDQVLESIDRLAGNPALCETLGRQAKELVLRSFLWENTLSATEEVYRKVFLSYTGR